VVPAALAVAVDSQEAVVAALPGDAVASAAVGEVADAVASVDPVVSRGVEVAVVVAVASRGAAVAVASQGEAAVAVVVSVVVDVHEERNRAHFLLPCVSRWVLGLVMAFGVSMNCNIVDFADTDSGIPL
jgi:hypothetical protein